MQTCIPQICDFENGFNKIHVTCVAEFGQQCNLLSMTSTEVLKLNERKPCEWALFLVGQSNIYFQYKPL